MKVLYLASDRPQTDEWNSSYYRCILMARGLNRYTQHTAEVRPLWDYPDDVRAYDIVVVQRNLYGHTLAYLRHVREQGVTVVADFDDAFDLVPESNASAYSFWRLGLENGAHVTPQPLLQFATGLSLCHAALVPSGLLRQDWEAHVPVYWTPNLIDPAAYDTALLSSRQHPADEVWVGWGGSAGHRQSLLGSGVLTALGRIAKRSPQVRVVFCGNNADLLAYTDIPKAQQITRPWGTHADWLANLREFDLGLAPLSGGFDDRRSWLRGLEYAYMGLPWIGSNRPPYAAFASTATLVENEIEAWEAELAHHIQHLQNIKSMRYISEARELAEAATLERGIAAYAEILEAINVKV